MFKKNKKLGIVAIIFPIFLVAVSMITIESNIPVLAENIHGDQRTIMVDQPSERQVALQTKGFNHQAARLSYISSERIEAPQTIEEALDFEQYTKVNVVATGYTAGYESTGKTEEHPQYGITFSGVKVKRDLYSTIAADLNIYPLGTIFYIPSYGYGVVADKGSAIKGNKIDLYYETVADVYNEWGKQELDVYLIEMGDGSISEEVLLELNEDEAMQVFRSEYQ